MPSLRSEKCRLCSKLSAERALLKHGPEGTACWEGEPCHKRRTYYRHRERYNKTRRLKRQSPENAPLVVPVLLAPAAVLHLYRERVDAPLHAIGAELWMGKEKVAAIEPVHCLGLTSRQVAAYLQEVLQVFSQKYEVAIAKFSAQVELDPSRCPISPCPLHLH